MPRSWYKVSTARLIGPILTVTWTDGNQQAAVADPACSSLAWSDGLLWTRATSGSPVYPITPLGSPPTCLNLSGNWDGWSSGETTDVATQGGAGCSVFAGSYAGGTFSGTAMGALLLDELFTVTGDTYAALVSPDCTTLWWHDSSVWVRPLADPTGSATVCVQPTGTPTTTPTTSHGSSPTPTATKTQTATGSPVWPVFAVTVSDIAASTGAVSREAFGVNPDITANAGLALPPTAPYGSVRWGGNLASRYNYQTDVANTGYDWYFINEAYT